MKGLTHSAAGTALHHTQNHTRSVQSAVWRGARNVSQNIRVSTEEALPHVKVYEPQKKGCQPSPPSLPLSYTRVHTHTHIHLKAKGSELKPSPHLPQLSSPGHQTLTPLSALAPQTVSLSASFEKPQAAQFPLKDKGCSGFMRFFLRPSQHPREPRYKTE